MKAHYAVPTLTTAVAHGTLLGDMRHVVLCPGATRFRGALRMRNAGLQERSEVAGKNGSENEATCCHKTAYMEF